MYKAGDTVRVIGDTHYELPDGTVVGIPEGAQVVLEAFHAKGAKSTTDGKTYRSLDQVSFIYGGYTVRISADEVSRQSS